MKGFRLLFCFLAALLGGPLAFSQAQILVHLEEDTPQDTINKYLTELSAVELGVTSLSEVRLWEVPDTLFKGNDTILAIESPRYARRRPKIKETCHNYPTFIPPTTPGTQEFGPIFCAPSYLVPPGGGCEIVIALFDTGIDTSHSYYNGKEHYFWTNPNEIPGNGLDDDGNGYIDDVTGWNFIDTTANPTADSNGHGTHIAGTMIQMFELARMAGPPPPIRIMNLATQDTNGDGTLFGLIEAIDYAASQRVNILNLSLGYLDSAAINDTIPAPLAYAIDYARNFTEVLAVCAAGNESVDIDTLRHYPGAFALSNILTVSSSNCFDRLSLFSNFGMINSDIGAPGEDVFSTVPGDRWESKNGTSMATGIVSSICALMGTHLGSGNCLGPSRIFDPYLIRESVIISARRVPDFRDTVFSDGIINPVLALDTMYDQLAGYSGEAWSDDGDGIRLGQEATLPGVPVWLENPAGEPLLLDSTDTTGRYRFLRLPPHKGYRIRFGGVNDTLALSLPGPASYPDPVTGLTDTLTPMPRDSVDSLHAGYFRPLRQRFNLLLEGPVVSGSTRMNIALLRQELLPGQEPFSAERSDTLSFGANAWLPAYSRDTTADSAAVDWGMLEWRDGTDSALLDYRLPVILRADGRVVMPSGFDPFVPGGGTSLKFIGLRFRGHLQCLTRTAHIPGASPLDYTGASLTLTSPDARVDLGGGTLGITAGDADGDGVIDAADRAQTWNGRNRAGYLKADVNLDGVGDAADRAKTWNNRNTSSVLP